jgi:hypothetical protein
VESLSQVDCIISLDNAGATQVLADAAISRSGSLRSTRVNALVAISQAIGRRGGTSVPLRLTFGADSATFARRDASRTSTNRFEFIGKV